MLIPKDALGTELKAGDIIVSRLTSTGVAFHIIEDFKWKMDDPAHKTSGRHFYIKRKVPTTQQLADSFGITAMRLTLAVGRLVRVSDARRTGIPWNHNVVKLDDATANRLYSDDS
jgi:hypothetical protein